MGEEQTAFLSIQSPGGAASPPALCLWSRDRRRARRRIVEPSWRRRTRMDKHPSGPPAQERFPITAFITQWVELPRLCPFARTRLGKTSLMNTQITAPCETAKNAMYATSSHTRKL